MIVPDVNLLLYATVRGFPEHPRAKRWLVLSGEEEVGFTTPVLCGFGGNLTTDAQIAALAIEYQGVVHSNDADFARFEGLRWENPLG